jgi:class 3 adenylate cyclase
MSVTESLASSADSRERTILTTDVVGSTALLRRYPNDMMGAMDLHDQILHAAIRHHSGDPFRSTGDGVLAIFDRPLDAVIWHPHGPDPRARESRLLWPCFANGHAIAERG